jgi:hypothetical protein
MRTPSARTCAHTLLLSLVLPLALGASPRGAQAQSCHGSSLPLEPEYAFRASLGSTFATYRNHQGEGDYQGLSAALAYAHPWLYVELTAPGYRLDDDDEVRYGMGDLASDVRLKVVRSADERLAAGLDLAATYPTGDSDHGFGMGHVMLMPGGWLLFRQDAMLLLLQLNYGASVGGSHGHGGHAHGSTSIVQPMNASELVHAVSLAYRFHPQLRALARLAGAVPVADRAGQAREAVAFGLAALLGRFDVSAEVQLPVIGDPFRARTLLQLGASW